MKRRRLLALCGGSFASVAGCLSGPATDGDASPDDPTESPTSSPTPTTDPSPSPAPDVVVEDVVVRKAVTYESTMGSGGVLAAEGRQYVVASVRAPGELQDPSFVFETEQGSWAPGLPHTSGAATWAVAGHGGGAVGDPLGGEESYLAFPVPSPLETSNPRIRLVDRDAEWPLPGDGVDRLAAPEPRFELGALTVPAEVSQGDPLPVSLTVTNVSETDGRFLAAVYWPTNLVADDDESRVVEREVPAGDEVTASLEIDTRYTASESGPVTLVVRGHVAAEREVLVRDVSTPS